MAAEELQKAQNRIAAVDLGQQTFFFAVEGAAQHRAQQEESQIGQQGEVVRGLKQTGHHAQRHEEIVICPDMTVQIQSRQHHRRAHGHQRPVGQLLENRPQQHTGAKAVEHTKVDEDALVRKVQKVHPHRHGADQKAAAENDQPPLYAAAAQRHADAGNQQKQHTAPALDEAVDGGIFPAYQPVQLHHVIYGVDYDHAEDADPPGRVQLPDPFFHRSSPVFSASSTR